MVNVEPQISDNARYSVTEAARVLGVHRNTIRQLTDKRELKCKVSPRNGRRYYPGRELRMFWRRQVI